MARDNDSVATMRGSSTALALCIGVSVLIHVIVLGISAKTISAAASGAHDGSKTVLSASLVRARVSPPVSSIAGPIQVQSATVRPTPVRETRAWPRAEVDTLWARTAGSTATLRDYFLPAELTERPHIVVDIDDSYPLFAEGEESAVVTHKAKLRLLIDQYGNVDGVIPEASDMPPTMLDVIVERFSAAKFKPGSIFGFAVSSQLLAEVVITPPETQLHASELIVVAGTPVYN